jgi:hypothetical protein
MNWLIGIACVSALLATAAVVLIVRYGSDDHDLESKLAAALEDELFGGQ